MKQWIIIGVVVVLLLASYFWNRSRTQQPEGEDLPPVEEVMVREDGQVVKKVGDTEQVLSAEEAEAMKKAIREKVGEKNKTELTQAEGGMGTGTAAQTYEDNTYYLVLTVSDLPMPQKGYYYEAWLKEGEELMSLGRIDVSTGQGEVLYSSSEDKSGMNQIVISYEQEGGPEDPDKVVMTGTFGQAEVTASPQAQ